MTQADYAVSAIGRILNARSIAVVGASHDPHKYGYMTLDCLLRSGYSGDIYPVNPKGGEFFGLKAYRSTSEVPEPLDVTVIIVPAKFVPGVLREAAAKGAAGAIICSGGFRESGNSELEEEIKKIAKDCNLRLMGPNISGIAYLPNRMCAQFFPILKTQGPLAVISQSGTVTNGLCEWASMEGIGVSAGINLGNQADICESDYLNYFTFDENTKAIVMYLEGIRDGRRFLHALKQTTPHKPVALIKGGRTTAGQRSTASHTGSLASNHKVFSAACRQCGAVVAEDIETLYDFGKALATMQDPKGKRILSISTSGGANTLAMDEIDNWGLKVPVLPKALVSELKKLQISPLADFSNPVDLVSLSAEDFKRVALAANKYDIADILLINFGDPVIGDLELIEFLDANVSACLVVSYFAGGEQELTGREQIQQAGFPVYPAPERAIRAIGAKVWETNYRLKRS